MCINISHDLAGPCLKHSVINFYKRKLIERNTLAPLQLLFIIQSIYFSASTTRQRPGVQLFQAWNHHHPPKWAARVLRMHRDKQKVSNCQNTERGHFLKSLQKQLDGKKTSTTDKTILPPRGLVCSPLVLQASGLPARPNEMSLDSAHGRLLWKIHYKT